MTAHGPEKLAWEARAKIMWGDSASEVKDWLTDSGLSSQQIRDILARSLEERDAEFRKRGLSEIIIGLAIAVGAVVAVVGLLAAAGISIFSPLSMRGGFVGFGLLVTLYGLFRLGRGVRWAIRGGACEGSLSKHD